MTAPRPTLDEPVIISRFWKSPRDRKKHVRMEFSEYEGHPLFNVRIWQTGSDGIDRPTVAGIALAIRKLPELADGINKALRKARELGFLDEEEAQP
jgi:hypothetical protein